MSTQQAKDHRIISGPAAGVTALLLLAVPLGAQHEPRASRRLDSEEIHRAMHKKDWVLVDTRPTDAYNGWALDGIPRGGHIPGAVDFPANWLDWATEDWATGDWATGDWAERLMAALAAKGIDRHKQIVLYGTDERDLDRVARFLRQAGFKRPSQFDLREWAADEARPLVRYKNFHLLVPAAVVKQLLDGRTPETFEQAQRVKFVEASWGDESASYSRGHVPGSFHVNTDDFEPPPQWRLGSPEQLARFAARYGFQSDDTVIVSAADPTASYRLAIVLRYMGVSDVRVLNGGFSAWKAARYPLETRSNPPPPAAPFGTQIPARPMLVDSTQTVKAQLRSSREFTLVDTRTWAEFVGQTSGYKYHAHRGRIPGAVYGQGDSKGANSLAAYRNIDNTMRNADEILQLWSRSGIDTQTHLSFMCGSGWRAAEVLTFAQVIGLSRTSLYSDGWIGWSNDPGNPVDSGDLIGSAPIPR